MLLLLLLSKHVPLTGVGHGWDLRVVHLLKGGNLRLELLPIEPYKGAFIAHLVAVVWCGEYSKNSATLLVLIPLLFNLMGSNQVLKSIIIQEPLGNIRSKLHAHPTFGGMTAILVARVGPQALTHDTFICWLTNAVDLSDVI